MGKDKNALLVGNDDYEPAFQPLEGCIDDVKGLLRLLEKNQDGTRNFFCEPFYANVTRQRLREKIEQLFASQLDLALFYFSGHGTLTPFGGYLIAKDSRHESDGVPMDYLIRGANQSGIKHIVIILDCCHAGAKSKR